MNTEGRRLVWLSLTRAIAAAHGNHNSDPNMVEIIYGPQATAALEWFAALTDPAVVDGALDYVRSRSAA